MQEENFYFTWLSLINVDIYTFIKLMRPICDVKELFHITTSSKKFHDYLVQNNIFISKDLYQKFVDFKIKQRAKNLFNYLIQNNVRIIHIFSKEYNKIIKNCSNPPIVFFLYGNLELLYNEKIYLYLEQLDGDSKIIKNSIERRILDKNYVLVKNHLNDFHITDNRVNIIIICSLNEINGIIKNKQKNNVLYIFTSLDYNENISCFIDKLLIINSSYKKEIVYLVDSILEQGKDIFVVPNNILNKYAYFSNYLISEGAKVIINTNTLFL